MPEPSTAPASQVAAAVEDLREAIEALQLYFGTYGVVDEVRDPLVRAFDRLGGR